MALTFTTPLMGLILPTVGQQLGPDWASNINDAFLKLESHDHTTGKGNKIPLSGIAINIPLDMLAQAINNVGPLRATDQAATLTDPSDIRVLYVVNGDLYYNNAGGTPIKITAGVGLNAASIGGIGGDYATSTASAFYTDISKTFTFTQDSAVPAKMDHGSLKIREDVLNGNGIGLKAPSGLTGDYDLTFFPALPSVDSVLTVSTAGVVTPVAANFLCPTGVILPFAAAAIPTGWLLCDGSPVSRTTYADLFSVISTTYGTGNGTTTFNIPDMRAMILRGAGTSAASRTMANGSQYAGGSLGDYSADQNLSHDHSVSLSNSFVTTVETGSLRQDPGVGGYYTDVGPGGSPLPNLQYYNHAHTVGVSLSGTSSGASSRAGVEAKPATISVNYIIKV